MLIPIDSDGYQINLNGGIIANAGFVRHVGFPNAQGVYALNANYTSLWGAMQSLGQMIAMVSPPNVLMHASTAQASTWKG